MNKTQLTKASIRLTHDAAAYSFALLLSSVTLAQINPQKYNAFIIGGWLVCSAGFVVSNLKLRKIYEEMLRNNVKG